MCAFGTKIRQISCRGFVLSDCEKRIRKILKNFNFFREALVHLIDFPWLFYQASQICGL
jgi:hypothetical protein